MIPLPTRVSDPTRQYAIRKNYERLLIGLFDTCIRNIEKELLKTENVIEYSKFQYYVNTKSFKKILDNRFEFDVYQPSIGLVDQSIRVSYSAGHTTAATNPRIKQYRINIPNTLSLIDQRVIGDLKDRNFNLITDLGEETKERMMTIFKDGVEQGLGIRDIASDLATDLSGMTEARARTIARTELSYSYNTAIEEAYKAVGVEQWQWLSALGYTTCEECEALHGQVFEIDGDDEIPPKHPNCLCTLYPVVDKPFEK